MRKLFMTDIHGDHMAMMKLLDHAKFDPSTDQLIIGGDMIDRGKDSGLVVKEIRFLCEQYPDRVKAVIGNHEVMSDWYMNSRSRMWLMHGGIETIDSFNKVLKTTQEKNDYLDWLSRLPLYVEDEAFIYTHAGFNPYDPLEHQDDDVVWMVEGEFYSYPKEDLLSLTKGKPIIHGHTPCEYIIFDGVRLNGDLGSQSYSIIEERGLALVDLTNMLYYVYKSHTKKITERRVLVLDR